MPSERVVPWALAAGAMPTASATAAAEMVERTCDMSLSLGERRVEGGGRSLCYTPVTSGDVPVLEAPRSVISHYDEGGTHRTDRSTEETERFVSSVLLSVRWQFHLRRYGPPIAQGAVPITASPNTPSRSCTA